MATIDFKRLETLSKTYDGVLQVKKTVASVDDLPNTGVTVGDVYMVGEENPTPYMWNGENFAPFGGASADVELVSNKVQSLSADSTHAQYPSAKLLYDQLNGYTDLVPVTGRKLTGDEAHLLGISESDDYIAIENPAGSGEKKLIIKYPVEDGRFDNTDSAVIWSSMSVSIFDRQAMVGGQATFVEPISHNSNVLINSSEGAIFIPLNDNGKVILEGEVGAKDDYAEIVIPDNSIFVFHTGGVMSMDSPGGNAEPVQDSGSVVVLTEETLSPVARRSDFNGYTEYKQLPVREMTAEEKEAWLDGWEEEEAAAYGFSTFMAYTNPAGSEEKTIRVNLSTESGHYIALDNVGPNYADSLTWIENHDSFIKGSSRSDGILEFEVVLPENTTILLAPCCYATEEDADNEENPILDATFNIEIAETVTYGKVLREGDVATAEKEANLLGFIELNSTVKGYMLVRSGKDLSLGFNEYTAYMQNYGPLSVYPAAMASTETIDGLLVDESTVEADGNFQNFVKGYALNSHVDRYTVETELEGTTIYPAKFNCFPSLVCIGKTGDEERWICTNILDAAGLSGFEISLGQRYIKYSAVYDAKPKLTQVAASVHQVMQQ